MKKILSKTKNACLGLIIGLFGWLTLLSNLSYCLATETSVPKAEEPLEVVELEQPAEQGLLAQDTTRNLNDDAKMPVQPASLRRGLPAPLSSPPFPSSEWQIGGTNPIGVPDTSDTFLLMKTLHPTSLGSFLEKKRIKIYGWIDGGGNLSTSRHSNAPAAYNVYPNRLDLNQVLLRVERLPDTVQTQHVDWGFHVSNIYGLDYRYTTAKGIFSNQLLKKNRQYGYDPLLVYGDIYLPKVAKGMNIRIGRFLSIPDIEAQLAPDNYMYTHSIMYTYDAYTQQGVLLTTKLNNQWSIQGGLTDGNDIAVWTKGAKLTGLAAVQWTSKSNNDSIYLVANSLNSGKYGYNNLQEFVATWSHRFNNRVHTKTEGWYMYQKNVPARALPIGVKPGYAPEWAIVNYLLFKLSDKSFITLRNEIVDDIKGQRTGYATKYSEHAIGLTYWLSKSVALRPELRYEHSYNTPAYDNGRYSGQFMAAMDLICRF
jgi:hypothetical protein